MTEIDTGIGTEGLDRIENEIHIAADAETVWDLISRPGWWINDDEVDDHPELTVDGDRTTLIHPEWGAFTIFTVASERPHRVSYRWSSAPTPEGQVPTEEGTTLVELTIEDEPGGVRLRVVESGFAALSADVDVVRERREANREGWGNELRAARDFVTAHRG